jgi:hypothetical protein
MPMQARLDAPRTLHQGEGIEGRKPPKAHFSGEVNNSIRTIGDLWDSISRNSRQLSVPQIHELSSKTILKAWSISCIFADDNFPRIFTSL